MKILLLVLLTVMVGAIAWLATRPAVPKSYGESYREALRTWPGSELAIDAGLERFRSAYADLSSPRTEANIRSLYAENIYFHDTLQQFDQNTALAAYMGSMAQSIESSSVRVDQIVRDGSDVFLRWTMRFVSRTAGGEMISETIGMTHLRFNERGEVILHQDFWDPASGLYRHLPVLGWLLHQVDRRVGSH
jgi:hypothetical protein